MPAGTARSDTLISGWQALDTGLADGRRVCAIGDVHGCSPQFKSLLDALDRFCPEYDCSTLVLTGDLIDRGPDSLGALDAAAGAAERGFNRVVPLMGNHEQMLRLSMLDGPLHDRETWMMNGGGSVLRELGLPESLRFEPAAFFAEEVAASLGQARVQLLDSLFHHQFIGRLLFVHAGINPLTPLESHLAQPWHLLAENHWAWIRHPFLSLPSPLKRLTVVHGHSPVTSFLPRPPERGFLSAHGLRDGKINLDAGSIISGSVAGAEFINGSYRILLQPGLPGRVL